MVAIAQFVWAVGKMSISRQPLIKDHVTPLIQSRLPEFNCQELSIITWAYAKLNQQPLQLLNEMAETALNRVTELSPQQLANISWAYAKLGFPATELLNAIAAEAEVGSTPKQNQTMIT